MIDTQECDLLISCIGTGNYQEVNYCWRNEEFKTNLFPAAAVHFLKPGRVAVLATKEAEGKWWNELETRISSGNSSVHVSLVSIPFGKNEEELWRFFEKIIETASKSECLALDVTHGFRTQPLFVLAAAAFLTEVRRIDIKHILYGAFEAKDEVANVAPVFDLKPAVDLFVWMGMARDLLHFGDGYGLADEAEKLHANLRNSGVNVTAIKNISRPLREFSDSVQLDRTRDVGDGASRLSSSLQKAGSELSRHLPPLALLAKELSKSVASIFPNAGSLMEQREALLRWYAEHNYFYQATSLLRELVVSYTAMAAGCPEKESDKKLIREEIEDLLNLVADRPKNRDMQRKLNPETAPGRNAQEFLNDPLFARDIASFWSCLRDIRNNLMHAQFTTVGNKIERSSVKKLISDGWNVLDSLKAKAPPIR